MATRSLLEKTIVHLLNGDEDKAAALFHKFMVEKARQIHESLRQDEDIDLGEGWNNEIQEEEYFDDGDLAADDDVDGDETGDSMDDLAGMNTVDDDGTGEDNLDPGDDFGDSDVEDMDALGADDAGLEGDDESIESKIDALTAQFDTLMGALEDSGVIKSDDMGEMGDDDGMDDGMGDDLSGDDFQDVEGEEPTMDSGETDDLADRMDSDLGDDDHPDDTMESADMETEGDELDEELADITESVLSELDQIAKPANTDGKEIGSGGKTIGGNRKSSLPNNDINNRVDGAKPYLVKATGDAHNDSFEREEAPPRKTVQTIVPDVRKGNVRTSFKDTMSAVPKGGDGAALLNKDFAGGGEDKGRSPVDGKMKPKTK
jgi:hypothetical protein